MGKSTTSDPSAAFVMEVIKTLDRDDLVPIAELIVQRLQTNTIIDVEPSADEKPKSKSRSKSKSKSKSRSKSKSNPISDPEESLADQINIDSLQDLLNNDSIQSLLNNDSLQGLLNKGGIDSLLQQFLGGSKGSKGGILSSILGNGSLLSAIPTLFQAGSQFFSKSSYDDQIFGALAPFLSKKHQLTFGKMQNYVKIFKVIQNIPSLFSG